MLQAVAARRLGRVCQGLPGESRVSPRMAGSALRRGRRWEGCWWVLQEFLAGVLLTHLEHVFVLSQARLAARLVLPVAEMQVGTAF